MLVAVGEILGRGKKIEGEVKNRAEERKQVSSMHKNIK